MSQNTSGRIAWLANSKDSISKTLFRMRTHLICSDKTYFKGTIRGDQKCNRDLTGLWLRKCFWRKWVKSRAAPQQIWGGHFHQREPTSFSRTTHPQRPSDCSCGYSEWFEILSSSSSGGADVLIKLKWYNFINLVWGNCQLSYLQMVSRM